MGKRLCHLHDVTTNLFNNLLSDHRIEPTRLREVRDLRRDLSPLFEARSHQIWTGDFNALTREDYSPEFWEDVSRIRENNKWELPQTDLTREVRNIILKKKNHFLIRGK